MPAPTITAASPAAGLIGSSYQVTLTGTNFEAAISNVRLTRSGFSDIVGTGIVYTSATSIKATFDLTGKAPGEWFVQVVNPVGGTGVSASALFTVAPAATVDILSAPNACAVGTLL